MEFSVKDKTNNNVEVESEWQLQQQITTTNATVTKNDWPKVQKHLNKTTLGWNLSDKNTNEKNPQQTYIKNIYRKLKISNWNEYF